MASFERGLEEGGRDYRMSWCVRLRTSKGRLTSTDLSPFQIVPLGLQFHGNLFVTKPPLRHNLTSKALRVPCIFPHSPPQQIQCPSCTFDTQVLLNGKFTTTTTQPGSRLTLHLFLHLPYFTSGPSFTLHPRSTDITTVPP